MRRQAASTTLVACLLLTVACALLALTLLDPAVPVSRAAAQDSPQTIVVGIFDNPPLSTVDDGEVGGFIPDVIEAVADERGLEIEYRPDTWPRLLTMLETGSIDVLAPIAWTPERQSLYEFTDSTLLTNWGVIIHRKSDTRDYEQIEHLSNASVGVLPGDVFLEGEEGLAAQLAEAGVEADVIEFDSYREAVDAVAIADLDCALLNRLAAQELGENRNIIIAPLVFEPVAIRIAGPKTDASRSLLAKIDATLSAMQLDPDSPYHAAVRTHLPSMTPDIEQSPAWVDYVLWGAAAAVALSVGTMLVLRTLIARRTRDLRVAVERFKALFTAIPDAVFVMSEDGVILDHKPTPDWPCPLPADGIIGSDLSGLELPSDSRQRLEHARQAVTKDGETRMVTFSTRDDLDAMRYFKAVLSMSGTFEVLMIVRETTEEVLAQQAERERAHELENAIAARTEELVKTNLELTAASQAKSVFLANMSHELRTPLNSVIGFSGTLLAGMAGKLNEEQHRQLEMVNTAGRHLLSLVDDVLDLSRVESGRSEPRPTEVDVASLLRDAVASIENRASAKGIGIAVEITDPGTPQTDRRMLMQIVLNLLNNAVKFTAEGCVTARAWSEDYSVIIEVEDTGPGIPEEELSRVFTSFYQIQRSDIAKSSGFGLGLPISARLAEMLEGTIEVASEIGRGSRFRLTLPSLPINDSDS